MRHLPNLLTGLRLALTPWALWAIVGGSFRRALAILAVAGLTDALDGLMARRLKASSRVGAYLDPIADKLLLSGSYVALGVAGMVPLWLVLLILGRDAIILAMAGAALLFTSERDFPPSLWGKLSTLCQLTAAVVVLVAGAFPDWRLRPGLLLWMAAAATAWSGIEYMWRGVAVLRGQGSKAAVARR
jgi:cardiolipin synthase